MALFFRKARPKDLEDSPGPVAKTDTRSVSRETGVVLPNGPKRAAFDREDDDWGLGFRLNIPHLGPLRLDYGIPITHDKYNGGGGKFQFGAGYTREF